MLKLKSLVYTLYSYCIQFNLKLKEIDYNLNLKQNRQTN